MSRVCSINVHLHTVVGAGENTQIRMVKELLWEDGYFYHRACTCILCAQLIIVRYTVK